MRPEAKSSLKHFSESQHENHRHAESGFIQKRTQMYVENQKENPSKMLPKQVSVDNEMLNQ